MLKSEFKEIECACGGIDDKMYVFITDGSKSENVLEYLTEKLKFNRAAFNVVDIDRIPKTEARKTRYIELEKYYQ